MSSGGSALATTAFVLAILALVAVVAGPLAIHAGAVSRFLGFRIFGLGLLASVPILLLGVAALIRTRSAARRAGRPSAVRATVLSALMAGLFLALALPARRVPPIHDITTDPADPPDFVAAVRAPENQGGMAYPAENATQQQLAYPDVTPLRVKLAPADAYAAAQRAAAALGWTVVRSDPSSGTFEATSTSRIFRFVDDVSVRVRPDADGARVDLRSRSRVGKSDLGANAARIRAFSAALA